MPNLFAFIADNKATAVLWALFSAATWFAAEQLYTKDEQFAAVRALATKTEAQESELKRAIAAIAVHDELSEKLDAEAEKLSKSLDGAALSPPNTRNTVRRLIESLALQRAMIAQALPEIEQLYFEVPALKALQAELVQNLKETDQFLETRRKLGGDMLEFPERGDEIVAVVRENADGKLFAKRALVRDQTFAQLLEQARRNFNDQVIDTNAKLQSYRRRQTLTNVSAACAGGIVGGFVGFLLSRRRRRKKEAAEAAGLRESERDLSG